MNTATPGVHEAFVTALEIIVIIISHLNLIGLIQTSVATRPINKINLDLGLVLQLIRQQRH